ncbi:hypothetical protein DDO73_18280 [Vibrio cholerae]|nr:hypothetical protein [Vibrio cholerae]
MIGFNSKREMIVTELALQILLQDVGPTLNENIKQIDFESLASEGIQKALKTPSKSKWIDSNIHEIRMDMLALALKCCSMYKLFSIPVRYRFKYLEEHHIVNTDELEVFFGFRNGKIEMRSESISVAKWA